MSDELKIMKAASKAITVWSTALANMSGRPEAFIVEAWSERAAVREYLGGMEREEAEREARKDVEREVLGG